MGLREKLDPLIERLEGATEGSRELGDAVLSYFGWTHHTIKCPDINGSTVRLDVMLRPGQSYRPEEWEWLTWQIEANIWPCEPFDNRPDPTTDLNAALALMEEKLPGWIWRVGPSYDTYSAPRTKYVAWATEGLGADEHDGFADSPALALILALLSALKDQQDD